jgi:HAE1 family hydrophobic/amphiphilic exporter-1
MKSLPAISVRNPVLVNLMMFGLILGGVYSSMTLVKEMFPESRPNRVNIFTPYPGASPAEVEKGISIKIEEQIKDIEGVEEIETVIREGSSRITAVLFNDVDDLDRVVTDIKNAIDAIPRDDFPDEAEETVVSRFEPVLPVISVSWYGEMTDEELKTWGKRLRDDVLALPGVTKVTLDGAKRDEISVEVFPVQLQRYNLSLLDVTEAVRSGNLDLPGGVVRTPGANVAVRTLGESDTGEEIARLIVRGGPRGDVLRLSDIGRVVDGFEDTDLESRIDGKPGVSVTVSKTPSQDAVEISRKVRALVAGKMGEPFESDWVARLTGRESALRAIYDEARETPYPHIGRLKTHTNLARFIEGRLDLLQRNGMWGLIFVFLSLLFFLNWRVAFWVMLGLLLAILGTLAVMNVAGITLNLISMFGLIVVLGMLVDDAIIVGEHVYTKIEAGEEPELAAIRGAEEVTIPVTIAIATTIVAFVPLLFIDGQIGDFMGVLPLIVIFSLGISLFEALTILPSHLAETFIKAERSRSRRKSAPVAAWSRLRGRLRAWQVDILENRLRAGYARALRTLLDYRYATMSVAVAGLVVSLGMILGGKVEVVPFQKMDSDTLTASIEMPVGTPIDRTDAVMRRIEEITAPIPEINTRFSLIGANMDIEGGGAGDAFQSSAGQMIMELLPSEERERSSDDILLQLRESARDITGVNALSFGAVHGGPGGNAIQIEISSPRVDDLVVVAGRIKDRLREFVGVYDIEDDFDAGQREVQVELLESGRALGLTTERLALQVRAAFYGLEARKIQRDREDVKIMVRFPRAHRSRIADLEQMRVAVADGTLVPITEVARIREGTGFATIRRKNQMRTVIVVADVDEAQANARDILAKMSPFYEELKQSVPGVRFAEGGASREFVKSFSSLKRDYLIALVSVFVLLAGLFKSYLQPIIVMTAIPFGLIGAVFGHYVMGYPLTMMSMIGLVALTGIVVNDSLILVDFINRRVRSGVAVRQAVIDGGMARLRAIMLTSITTVLGLAPLLTEQSFQAKFLIPMGISIAFGLVFATALTLVVVPCLYVMLEDARRVLGAVRAFLWPGPTQPSEV